MSFNKWQRKINNLRLISRLRYVVIYVWCKLFKDQLKIYVHKYMYFRFVIQVMNSGTFFWNVSTFFPKYGVNTWICCPSWYAFKALSTQRTALLLELWYFTLKARTKNDWKQRVVQILVSVESMWLAHGIQRMRQHPPYCGRHVVENFLSRVCVWTNRNRKLRRWHQVLH
jgi:hypothetical protein